MSKPATILAGAAAALALAAVLGVCALRERRQKPAPAELPPSPAAAGPQPAPAAAEVPSPPSPVPAAAPPRLPRPAPTAARKPMDEDALLAKINKLGPSDLELTLKLAREAIARFPDSPKAPEFEMNIAKSLLHLGRVEEAREQARHMLRKYPGNSFTLEVEHHLLRAPPNPQ